MFCVCARNSAYLIHALVNMALLRTASATQLYEHNSWEGHVVNVFGLHVRQVLVLQSGQRGFTAKAHIRSQDLPSRCACEDAATTKCIELCCEQCKHVASLVRSTPDSPP